MWAVPGSSFPRSTVPTYIRGTIWGCCVFPYRRPPFRPPTHVSGEVRLLRSLCVRTYGTYLTYLTYIRVSFPHQHHPPICLSCARVLLARFRIRRRHCHISTSSRPLAHIRCRECQDGARCLAVPVGRARFPESSALGRPVMSNHAAYSRLL